MKKIFIAILVSVALHACNSGDNYKVIRQQVLDAHDKIMIDGEIAINNKMKLDTIASQLDSLARWKLVTDSVREKENIITLQSNLNYADEQMSDWMHKFDAELAGKSNQEKAAYFKSETKKVKSLDSLYKQAISESDAYLAKFRK